MEQEGNIVPFVGSRELVSREEITTAVQLWRFDRDLSEALTRAEIGAMSFMQRVDAQRKTLIMGFATYLRRHPRSDVAMGVYLITTLLSDNDRGQCTVSQPTMAKLFGRSVSSIADAQRRLREEGMVVTGKGRYAGSTPVMPRLATLQHNNLTWIIAALATDDATANDPAPRYDCQSSGPTGSLSQSSGRPEGLKSVNHPVEPVSIIRPDPMQSLSNNSTTLNRAASAVATGIAAAVASLPLAANPAPPPAMTQPSQSLEDRLLEAGGAALANPANSAGLLILSEPNRWLSQGYDLELDILPAIRGRSLRMPPGSIKSWSYFTQAVADAKATREKPMPIGNPVATRPKNWHDEQDEIRAKLKAVWDKMGDVVKNFLGVLGRQFTMPKGSGDDPVGWTNDYVEALDGYTDSLLALAAKTIIKNRETRSFPLVAECVKACRDTLDALAEPDLKKPIRGRHDEWSEENRSRADKMFVCELGRDAVKEGWAWTLWDWLRVNGRYPDRYEIEKIREKGMANTRKFWQMMNNPPPVMNQQLAVNPKTFIAMHRHVNERLRKLVT